MHAFLDSFRPPRRFSPPPRFVQERRGGTSPLELALLTLSHSIDYLIAEQRTGSNADLRSSREAIALLCDGLRNVMAQERRADLHQRASSLLQHVERPLRDRREVA